MVGTVDAATGEFVTYTEKSIDVKDLPHAIVASSSVPFVFEPTKYFGKTLIDGGSVWGTNMQSAIDRCKEIVEDDTQIIMDVITCKQDKRDVGNSTGSAIHNFMRAHEISSNIAGV